MSATNIDWDLIKNLDPVQIKHSKDSKSINAIIKSINSSFISSDLTVFSNNPLTPRLIQLLQISIQYLLSFQKHLSNTIEKKNKEIAQLQKKYIKIGQEYRQLIIINENLRKPREVCPTCGKKFKIGYLDKHFQSRHPELIVPWNQIRSKSSNYNPQHDKAIIDELSAIQKAKESRNKLEINKGGTVQISPNKENKSDSKPHQPTNDEQISLNQGQLDQMVDEISKRVSERISIDKNSNSKYIESNKSSQTTQSKQTTQKSNSVPSQQLQQFTVDARRHDQSLNHQHYIQQNNANESVETDFSRENPNISVNSLKKNSGNRVVFDPSVIENHCDSRRRNRNMNEVNEYDDYDYNDEYNNEDNENYNYNSPINSDRNRQYEDSTNLNGQKGENLTNELDDFIMGSSDVAISNQKSKPKISNNQQKNQTNSTQLQKNNQYTQNNDDIQNEFDEFMVDSSEIAASNRQNNPTPNSQPKLQQQKQQTKYTKQEPVKSQNYNDFQDEFDDFMIESGDVDQQNISQKPKLQNQNQNQVVQNQQQQQKYQPKQQTRQQDQNQIKQNQQKHQTIQNYTNKPQQQKQKPINSQQQQQKQTNSQYQQQQQKPINSQYQQQKQKPINSQQKQTNSQYQQKPINSQQKQKPINNQQQQQQPTYNPSTSSLHDQDDFNDEFDAFMIDTNNPTTNRKPSPSTPSTSNRQTVTKSTPPQTRPIENSPASFATSPAPSSSASFPPSPMTPRPTNRHPGDKENSGFEFTDGSPGPSQRTPPSSSFRRSFSDEEAEEFKDFMVPPDELPKPPKRDLQGSYVAITNDELDDLIKESSSIMDDEKKGKEEVGDMKAKKKLNQKRTNSKQKKAFTNSELDAMIYNDIDSQKKVNNNLYDDNNYVNFDKIEKNDQIPPQFAHYSPSELEVILAEESSAMDNPPQKTNYNPKSNFKNDDDYYYQDNQNNNYDDNYKDDYYEDIPKESNYDNKYYNDDFNNDNKFDDNYTNPNFSNQSYRKDSFYEDDMKPKQTRQNLPENINKPPMSIAEARKLGKKKKKSQITTIGGVEFTDSQLAGFL